MALVPNIGPRTRAGYVAFGLALVLLAALASWPSAVWPVLVGAFGLVVAVEGAVGF